MTQCDDTKKLNQQLETNNMDKLRDSVITSPCNFTFRLILTSFAIRQHNHFHLITNQLIACELETM